MELNIIGYGINCRKHFTRQGINLIKSSQNILCLGDATPLLKDLEIENVISLNKLYLNGRKDQENYNAIVDFIVQFTNNHDKALLLVPGHPRLGVTIVNMLEKLYIEGLFNAKITVIESISSFDTIINDIKFDPLEHGTMILDVNRMLLYKHIINTNIGILLYHASSVVNPSTDFANPAVTNNIALLTNYLLNFYPDDHAIILIESSSNTYKHPNIIKIKIKELNKNSLRINFATTIYIPPTANKAYDKEILSMLME